MEVGDVEVGDDVKNGRNDRWATVERIDSDSVTGRITRLFVFPRDVRYGRARWWLADSITMTEKARSK